MTVVLEKCSVCDQELFLTKKFKFEAAHYLPNYDGKCSSAHGHSWGLEITVRGRVERESGMVLDFVDLKNVVEMYVIDVLDHIFLNDHFDNPTSENLVIWIKEVLERSFPFNTVLERICLHETENSYVEWRRKE